MNNILNETQQLRLLLIKESDFDLAKAEKMYNFIVGEQLKMIIKPVVNEPKPDGIYFILSPSNAIHESLVTDEDKHNCIAVGVKIGDKFANVVLHDVADSKDIALCQKDKISCGSKQFFRKTFNEAMSDWNGMANTNNIRDNLNPDINLSENEYIPSMAQLHLILLNINKINNALVEAGGEPMKDDWYWSSTEYSSIIAWYVNFNNSYTNYGYKLNGNVVRPSVICKL